MPWSRQEHIEKKRYKGRVNWVWLDQFAYSNMDDFWMINGIC